MVEATVERVAPEAPTATQVVARLAEHAALSEAQMRELLAADDELAALMGRLIAARASSHTQAELLGSCLPRRAVAELLGGISPQAVAQRDGLDLVAIRPPGGRSVLYPVFQFDGPRPLAGLADVLKALGVDDDGVAVACWLRRPNRLCGERTPEEALRAGDVDQARHAAGEAAATWRRP